ncbi:hypothetical protein H6A12_03980 [Phocea massiliensis]|uniref:Uncharacterized protein n=1 Tax=Merdimmobilis hominis TaxID=2897707 RepID=A0A938X6Z0_9FIRM|nr:hypothetical protein [Merdimmobilis hominis]MBM6920316.1 hypothetical protein [Merdimmobilis hominis]
MIKDVLGEKAQDYETAETDEEKAQILKDAGLLSSSTETNSYYARRMIHGLTLENGLVLDQGSWGGLNLVAFVEGAESLEIELKDGPAQLISISEGKYLSIGTSIASGVSTYTLTYKDADDVQVAQVDAKFYGVSIGGYSATHDLEAGESTTIVFDHDSKGQRIRNYNDVKDFTDVEIISSDASKVTVDSYSFDENGTLTVKVTRHADGQVHLRYLMTYNVKQFATDDEFSYGETNKTFCKVN